MRNKDDVSKDLIAKIEDLYFIWADENEIKEEKGSDLLALVLTAHEYLVFQHLLIFSNDKEDYQKKCEAFYQGLIAQYDDMIEKRIECFRKLMTIKKS